MIVTIRRHYADVRAARQLGRAQITTSTQVLQSAIDSNFIRSAERVDSPF